MLRRKSPSLSLWAGVRWLMGSQVWDFLRSWFSCPALVDASWVVGGCAPHLLWTGPKPAAFVLWIGKELKCGVSGGTGTTECGYSASLVPHKEDIIRRVVRRLSQQWTWAVSQHPGSIHHTTFHLYLRIWAFPGLLANVYSQVWFLGSVWWCQQCWTRRSSSRCGGDKMAWGVEAKKQWQNHLNPLWQTLHPERKPV